MALTPCDPCGCVPANVSNDKFKQDVEVLLCNTLTALGYTFPAKGVCNPCECIQGNIPNDKFKQDVEVLLCALIEAVGGIVGGGITQLTTDVTAVGPGVAAATIAAQAVTFAKMQNIATARLLGRSTAGSGSPEEISIGTGLSLAAGVLSSTAGMAIGGTVTAGTTGSVLFVGAGPVLAQDNAHLFWDDTNNRLGIGTNAPAYTLDVADNGRFAYGAVGGGNWYASAGDAAKWFVGTDQVQTHLFRFYAGANLVTFCDQPVGDPNFFFNQNMGGFAGVEKHFQIKASVGGGGTHGYDYLLLDLTEAAYTGTGIHSMINCSLTGSTVFAVERGRLRIKYNSVSADTTLDDTYSTVTVDASGGNKTITLPAASGMTGVEYTIKKIDASGNTVTVDGNGGETIDGAATKVLNAQYKAITIQCDGSNWYIIAQV